MRAEASDHAVNSEILYVFPMHPEARRLALPLGSPPAMRRRRDAVDDVHRPVFLNQCLGWMLLGVIVYLLDSSLLYAQQPSVAKQRESIVVTGSAEPVPLEEADRDLTVMPLPEKQRLLFNSWFDLLGLDSTLDFQQRAPGGFLADLSIRGATFGQTLVLLDGLRLNNAQTGHFNLDLPIPIEMIRSIEVLKGSGSTLYGSDAIGGVVNVRTRLADPPYLRFFGGLGDYGTNQQHAIGSFGGPRFSQQLAIARDFSSGFTTDRDYRNLALSSLTALKSRWGATNLLFAYSDRPFGADQFYGNYPSWERIKTWFGSAHQNVGDKTEASFAFRRNTDLFVLFRDRPQVYTNRHALESWQGNLRHHDELPLRAVLSYGAEGLAESIQSTNLGARRRLRGSGYVFYDVRAARRFSFSAGLREEVYGSRQVATSPSVSGAVWASPKFKIRASASRAFRLPSFTDLYYSDPANRGNSNLKPESATSYEAGVDAYLSTRLRASITVFQRRDTDLIDYVKPTSGDTVFVATNFGKLRFTGLEASTLWEPAAGHRIAVSFTALRGLNQSSGMQLSKYTFNYPIHNALVEWRGHIRDKILARTRIGVVNRLSRRPYGVWDASVGWTAARVRPFLQFTNITNTTYYEILNVLMPRRSVIGGIELVLFGTTQ